MTRITFLAICFLLVSACDSPMNNRVENAAASGEVMRQMSFNVHSFKVEAQWLVGPVGNLSVNNQLLVIVKDQSGTLTSLPRDKTLSFYATMPSMGHPLDDPGYFEQLDVGIYINRSIKYNMPGDWKNELWIMSANLDIEDKVIWHEFF